MFFYFAKIGWFLIQPSSLILLLILFSALLLWTRWAWFGRRTVLLGALLFLVAGLSPLGHVMYIPLEDRFARADLTNIKPDGIIVLGGAEETLIAEARNVPALNEAGERILETAMLAWRFPDTRVVFTGGTANILYGGTSEADSARTYLTSLGLSPDRLILEDKSRDTYENALFTRVLLAPKPGERWLLVTSAGHMPRAVGCFRALGFNVLPWPVDYRTRGKEDMMRMFDKPSQGLRRVDRAAREWIGILVYYVLGRTNALFPGP